VPSEPSDEEKHRVVKLKKLGNELLNVSNNILMIVVILPL